MNDLAFKSGLPRLPSELILLVAGSLEYHSEVNSLSRVSRHFYHLLNPVLYQKIANSGDRYTLTWAVRRGVDAAAHKSILAGITPTLDDIKVAIGENHESMVEILCQELALDQKGDDEPWRLSAFAEISELAALRSNISLTRLFISYGANPQILNQPISDLYKAAS
ncbi:hypothetical protein BDV19DRAFT_39995 [Aspergillus venezuelensis]